MFTQKRSAFSLCVVLLAAFLLAATLSRAATAGSLFQSSPPAQPTPDLPQPSPAAPQPTIILPAPTVGPLPTALLPAPTPSGYLPAPTLTNPNIAPPMQPPANPPLSGPTIAVEPKEPQSSAEGVTLAALIDAAIATLGYVWLCCGGLLLVIAAGLFVWLTRRSARRG